VNSLPPAAEGRYGIRSDTKQFGTAIPAVERMIARARNRRGRANSSGRRLLRASSDRLPVL